MTTKKRIRELLHYDEKTGQFTRKIDAAFRVKARKGQVAGSISNNGYLRIMIDGKSYLAHRLVFLYKGLELKGNIDHINGDKTDNRFCNLRFANHKENAKNTKLISTNTTGQMGVYFCNQTKPWAAKITANNKRFWLGRHKTYKEAVKARKEAEKTHGFHMNHGKR